MRKNLSCFQEINEALYLDNNFSRKNKRESVFYLNLCPCSVHLFHLNQCWTRSMMTHQMDFVWSKLKTAAKVDHIEAVYIAPASFSISFVGLQHYLYLFAWAKTSGIFNKYCAWTLSAANISFIFSHVKFDPTCS